MYTIKATKGNIDLSAFNLSDLTAKANATAEEIQQHNNKVYSLFRDLVSDYLHQINNVLVNDLQLSPMETSNKEFYIFHTALGLHINLKFGHGRAAVDLKFSTPYASGGKLSFDFSGKIHIVKRWLEDKLDVQNHSLESVGQFFTLAADVFKIHIIERDVKDFRQQMELEKQIQY